MIIDEIIKKLIKLSPELKAKELFENYDYGMNFSSISDVIITEHIIYYHPNNYDWCKWTNDKEKSTEQKSIVVIEFK